MYTPLIITEDGDLSGDVINTAARLQMRANAVSPSSTRITVTKHVVFRYRKESPQDLDFFNSGMITFKGTALAVYEVIFKKEDRYILQYQEEMQDLYSALEKNLWRNQVFPALITLLIKVCRNVPKFKLKRSTVGNKSIEIRNGDIIKLAEKTLLLYSTQDNYVKAVLYLRRIVDYLGKVQNFDSLVLEYALKITEKYERIIREFKNEIEKRLDDRYASIFPPETARLYRSVKKQALIYEKLKDHAMQDGGVLKKKSIWYTLMEENIGNLSFSLYSGKE